MNKFISNGKKAVSTFNRTVCENISHDRKSKKNQNSN